MNVTKMQQEHPGIVADIAQNLGWLADDLPVTRSQVLKMVRLGRLPEHYQERIAAMSPEQAFERWCTWKGFPGWSDVFWTVIESLKDAS